jgi:ABC-2 type transport system ATP-binding protein
MSSAAVDLKRRIGVMPETLALFDGLYAHELLSFQARMFGLDATTTRRRVDELLDALGLAAHGDKPLEAFSAGMRKRVAFAAAIVHAPELLFLDEPFESIDPAGVAMMKSWLRTIVAQGRTVFITSHVLDTVEHLCDRVAIVTSPGRLIWTGDITPLVAGHAVERQGRQFQSLESLYLDCVGQRATALEWI